MNKKNETYLFYGDSGAVELLVRSREHLIKAPSEEFMVYRIREHDDARNLEGEHPQEWVGPIKIDEKTFFMLYTNLCQKARRRFSKKPKSRNGNRPKTLL